jgi:DNA mismatch endonuclease, patch repair protein
MAGQPYPHASSAGRSANMRANRRTNTKPEVVLRAALHRLGYRYRKDHRLDLAGGVRVRPDIVFTARKVAVFVDGCFWHVCPEHGREPTVNEWYWTPKLRRNVERDRAADAVLAAAGWKVVRVWEHTAVDDALAVVLAVLGPRTRIAAAQAAASGLAACGAGGVVGGVAASGRAVSGAGGVVGGVAASGGAVEPGRDQGQVMRPDDRRTS